MRAGFFLVVFLASLLPVRAQGRLDSTVVLPGLTVTAVRTVTAADATPVRVAVLDGAALFSAGDVTVAEALSKQTAAFIRTYGSSGLATLSLRGTNPGQTLVLLDGMRVASPQLGQLDVSLLPTLLLESVEVVHGAASPLYGADALGGVVNLRTYRGYEGSGVRASIGAGAYGERTLGFLAAQPLGRLNVTGAVDFNRADGDYRYRNPVSFPAEDARREGADHERLAVYTSATDEAGGRRSRLSALVVNSERGLPGLATAAPQGERQWDEQQRLWGETGWKAKRGTWRLAGYLHRASLRYLNPLLNLDDTGRTLTSGAEAERIHVLGRRWLLGVGTSAGYGRADHPHLKENADEFQAAAFMHATGQFGRFMMYPALRLDRYAPSGSSAQTPLSPRLGFNVRLPHGLFAKANIGRAFRMPTFNDRFWQPGGNPDLRPEFGWTAESGLGRRASRSLTEITVYHTRTTDQIVWTPLNGQFYAPINVSRVRTLGLETSYRRTWILQPGRLLDTRLIYTLTDARDRSDPASRSFDQPVRYVPREQLKLSVNSTLRHFGLDFTAVYTGRRYVTSDATEYLDPYVVLDAQARFTRRLGAYRMQLALAVENLLDASYAVLQHYPMPPRHARIRLLIQSAD